MNYFLKIHFPIVSSSTFLFVSPNKSKRQYHEIGSFKESRKERKKERELVSERERERERGKERKKEKRESIKLEVTHGWS